LWAHRPEHEPRLGEVLSTDSDRSVRRTLAIALATLRKRRADLAEELAGLLMNDPSASVRALVRKA
jgi:hypothetical protein